MQDKDFVEKTDKQPSTDSESSQSELEKLYREQQQKMLCVGCGDTGEIF